MIVTANKKMIVSRMLAHLQACEKIYHAAVFSTVPNYTSLVFSKGIFTGREKIKISVNNKPPENAIISVEHGAQIARRSFLKLCVMQLKKIANAEEGEEIPALVFYKNAAFTADEEIKFPRRCEILDNGLKTGKNEWSAGGVAFKTREQDFPF